MRYLDESIVVITEGVQFGSAQVKKCLSIRVDNIVTLALLQVDEIKNLNMG